MTFKDDEDDHRNNARSWKQSSEEWQATAEEWERRARAAGQPRPLTPDAITDEMVKRARVAWLGANINLTPDGFVREILTAALTEPPARPEGAEDIEALVLDYKRENAHRGYSEAEIADYVAARLTDPTRKEA